MTLHSIKSHWPSPAPDPAAAALAELAAAAAVTQPGVWVRRAACRDARDDVHFPPGREDSPGYRLAARAAKNACTACPVISQCLAYALENGENEGIWGGTTPRERRAIWAAQRTARQAS